MSNDKEASRSKQSKENNDDVLSAGSQTNKSYIQIAKNLKSDDKTQLQNHLASIITV